MQLIKTQNGSYINANKVKNFYVDDRGRVYACFGLIVRNDGVVIDREVQLLGQFDNKNAAQARLDKIAAQLAKKFNTEE